MTAPPITVTPDAGIADVAALLIERRISAVPVVDESGVMVGIVSEGDLLRRAETDTERQRPHWLELLLGRNIRATEFIKTHGSRARDVMTRDVVTVMPDAGLAEVAALLEKRRIKRVPVVEHGRPIGIVSRANLLHGLVAYHSGSPAAERKASDTEIRDRLTGMLRDQSGVDLRRVNIVVNDGVVFLWGMVRSENQRRALMVAAESVPGVSRIEDNLHRDWFPGSFDA